MLVYRFISEYYGPFGFRSRMFGLVSIISLFSLGIFYEGMALFL